MRPHAPLSPGSSSHSDSNEGFRSPGSEERTDEEATGVNDEKFREDMQNLSTQDLVIMCNRMHYSVENLKVLLNDELETERMLQEQKKQEEERLEVHLKSLHDIQVTSKSTKFYETDYRMTADLVHRRHGSYFYLLIVNSSWRVDASPGNAACG
eukprot:GHVU01155571.1.p1 GENE.GHVU01155571.1~~GHVU01155571.1.p1  ORF type:complete len:154 (-),score=18.65 GHVU01155571.1:1901-2362(-)